MDDDLGYVADDTESLLIGPIRLERRSKLLWVGWLGGWRVSISNANPPAIEGDLQYRGPWKVRVGQRRTTVRRIDEGVEWIKSVLREFREFATWLKREDRDG